MNTYANSYNYNWNSSNTVIDETILSVIFVILGIFVLLAIIVCIFTVIGQWKMFQKAGEKGWKALIPIYNVYTLCQLTGVNPWWIVIVFVGGILSGLFAPLSMIGSLASLYFSVLLAVSTARSYQKEDAYAIGILFFPPIFYMILGLGKNEYLGKKPMKDIVLNAFLGATASTTSSSSTASTTSTTPNSTSSNSSSEEAEILDVEDTAASEQVRFCTQCGNKISRYDRFCPNCGKEI